MHGFGSMPEKFPEPEFDFDNDSEQNFLLKFESDRVREAAKTKFLSYLFVY